MLLLLVLDLSLTGLSQKPPPKGHGIGEGEELNKLVVLAMPSFLKKNPICFPLPTGSIVS